MIDQHPLVVFAAFFCLGVVAVGIFMFFMAARNAEEEPDDEFEQRLKNALRGEKKD
jgi:hypothetical protein